LLQAFPCTDNYLFIGGRGDCYANTKMYVSLRFEIRVVMSVTISA